MATLHAFKAVRPTADAVAAVSCVPYDVISTDEARQMAAGNPRSFLHVIRPEIDLPPGTDEHAAAVYATGAENLKAFVDASHTTVDPEGLYVYGLIMDGRRQTGIFGCVSVDDYDNDVILKHEKTRPDKEDDRTRHIVEQRAHAEPVMLTFKDDADVERIINRTVSSEALFSFVAADGVSHSLWSVVDPIGLCRAFENIPSLYVADGHHRCKAASRAAAQLAGSDASPEVRYFPAVLFPMGDMKILAYNRLVRNVDVSPQEFLERLRQISNVSEAVAATPSRPGEVSIYVDGGWFGITLPESSQDSVDAQLDVARLGEHILEPILGIVDPRRDPRIDFVGGIRGVGALEKAVDDGRAVLAISMFPTSIEELVSVSDAGLLMPPKSTWFEPKLRSGLLVHLF